MARPSLPQPHPKPPTPTPDTLIALISAFFTHDPRSPPLPPSNPCITTPYDTPPPPHGRSPYPPGHPKSHTHTPGLSTPTTLLLAILPALLLTRPLRQILFYWLRRLCFAYLPPPRVPDVLRSPFQVGCSSPYWVMLGRVGEVREAGWWDVVFWGVFLGGVAGGRWVSVEVGGRVVEVLRMGVVVGAAGVLGGYVVHFLVGVVRAVVRVVPGVVVGMARGVAESVRGAVGWVWGRLGWVVLGFLGWVVVSRFPHTWWEVLALLMGTGARVLMWLAEGLKDWAPGEAVEGVTVLRVIEGVGAGRQTFEYQV